MDPWWSEVLQSNTLLDLGWLAARLVAAALLGTLVALVHRLTARRVSETASLTPTLVLLSILIAAVTQVIGDNQARAFSLVGALAIIRFRTVVEDTRDTAFVICAVVVGMGAGAGQVLLALIALTIVAVAAFAMKPLNGRILPPSADYSLTVKISLKQGQESPFEGLFEQYLVRSVLQSTGTAKQGSVLELHWQVRLRPTSSPVAFVSELNRLEGIQSVELQRRASF